MSIHFLVINHYFDLPFFYFKWKPCRFLEKQVSPLKIFFLCVEWLRTFQLVLLHFLSPVTGVHVKVLSSAAVPLKLFRLLTPRSFRNGCYRATGESKVILLWSCQDARHASNVVELSSWILLIVKRPYAVSEKEQGNLLNEGCVFTRAIN